jgi:hypothetical protein
MVTSRPGCFTLEEIAPGSHLIGRWVGPRTGLDTVEKRSLALPEIEPGPSSLSLYQLAYPVFSLVGVIVFKALQKTNQKTLCPQQVLPDCLDAILTLAGILLYFCNVLLFNII